MLRLAVAAERLSALGEALLTLGRLEALGVLSESRLRDKLDRARRAVVDIEAAAAVADFTYRYFRAKPPLGSWPADRRPDRSGVLSAGGVDPHRLAAEIAALGASAAASVRELEADTAETTVYAALRLPLRVAASVLPEPDGAEQLSARSSQDRPTAVVKAVNGPVRVGSDPAFEPAYSLLERSVPDFGESITEAVPYFWGLALRESLAAELCALSVIEYDGLPLDFYRDFGKQMWDEMRHSVAFFEAALELLPELAGSLDADDPLQEPIRRFQETGRGLPVPKEGNLYEAVLNAGLVERLILMNIDTETPGIQRLRDKINSAFARARPELAAALEVVVRDEVTHSRFGKKWLDTLVPAKTAQQDAIADAGLLRGVYLLTSFAEHGDRSLREMLDLYTTGDLAGERGSSGL